MLQKFAYGHYHNIMYRITNKNIISTKLVPSTSRYSQNFTIFSFNKFLVLTFGWVYLSTCRYIGTQDRITIEKTTNNWNVSNDEDIYTYI